MTVLEKIKMEREPSNIFKIFRGIEYYDAEKFITEKLNEGYEIKFYQTRDAGFNHPEITIQLTREKKKMSNESVWRKNLSEVLCDYCPLSRNCKQGCIMSCAKSKIDELENIIGMLKDMSGIGNPVQCEKCGRLRDIEDEPECEGCEYDKNNPS